MKNEFPIRIVITGAESTGKTVIADALAIYFNTIRIPEFAREYIENLNHHYNYSDVEKIAVHQISQYMEEMCFNKYIFFDTWLIITKVWFLEVFGKYPDWLDNAILANPVDLYLVCDNDIDWVFDPVRENGHKRDYLKKLYLNEINKIGKPYKIIRGKDQERILNAIEAVKDFDLTH